ncbi:type II toxin-antitoxin system death-on-curing family toxin [Algoriphagus winogradskyi]|jgi:death-on-curing protein|uniref:Death on curing protein n=1 Tax=Algoriphagus winogradskyi TaxID=237017 RepID=A0ABY1NSB4_9BACT|nr:type II toxin-antitoxin system death-on-curing family toxin [Algoriphagus winogradskyi]SMP16933.1 death on curing protein [Algoriphagus winogradskyi]
MSIDFQYFTVEYAIEVHDNIVRESGGFFGVRDRGLIESTIEHMKNDFYYPEIEDKLTHLFYSINKNHCFNDGNKRASLALSVYFLYLNGLEVLAEKFILTMENIVVDVADNRIDRDLLFEIIQSILYEEDFSEELKIKIIHAKSVDDDS